MHVLLSRESHGHHWCYNKSTLQISLQRSENNNLFAQDDDSAFLWKSKVDIERVLSQSSNRRYDIYKASQLMSKLTVTGGSVNRFFITVGIYKGTTVCVKKLNVGHMDVTRQLKREMAAVRLFSHLSNF